MLDCSQDLQDDLSQMMNLQHTSPELQLSVYPRNGAEYVRHRDAFPDDGSDEHQRKVNKICQCMHSACVLVSG